MSDLQDRVLRVMHTGLAFAEGHLLLGERPMEAEGVHLGNLPADQVRWLLARLALDPGHSEQDLEDHGGLQPIDADRATHTVMAELLYEAFPGCYVVGEEATGDEWLAAEQTPQGALIFVVDAIDGSALYETLTFGYSTNVLAFRRTESQSRSELLLAAVANSSQFVAVYEAPTSVMVGSLRNFGVPGITTAEAAGLQRASGYAREDFTPGTVAVVAARAPHRSRASTLLADPALTIFTTGGAPAALGLVLGRLEALVSTSPQSLHDAAYLPILASLNVPILTETGLALSVTDVLDFFAQVATGPGDRQAHPVPTFVAARSPQTAARLIATTFNSPREPNSAS